MPHTSNHTAKKRRTASPTRGSSTSLSKDRHTAQETQSEDFKTNQNPGPILDAAWVGHMLREQEKRTSRRLAEMRAEMLVLVESNASRGSPSDPTPSPTPEVRTMPLVPSDHPLAEFIRDMLIQEDWGRARCGNVRTAYTTWASDHPLHKAWNHLDFAKQMTEWWPRGKSTKNREYLGVRLISRTAATLDIADRKPDLGGEPKETSTCVPVLPRQTSSAVVCASQSENTAESRSPHLEERDPESSSVTTTELPQCTDDDEQVSDECSDSDGSGASGDSDDADEHDTIN